MLVLLCRDGWDVCVWIVKAAVHSSQFRTRRARIPTRGTTSNPRNSRRRGTDQRTDINIRDNSPYDSPVHQISKCHLYSVSRSCREHFLARSAERTIEHSGCSSGTESEAVKYLSQDVPYAPKCTLPYQPRQTQPKLPEARAHQQPSPGAAIYHYCQ
jgi:hypothetical protein